MGATLEVIKHERMINHLMTFVDIDIHTSQNYIFNTSVYLIKMLYLMSYLYFPMRRVFLLLLC